MAQGAGSGVGPRLAWVGPGPVVVWGPGPVAVYSEIGYNSLYEKKREENGLGLAYRAGCSVGFYNNLFF
jgi:hypothetical protein